MPIIERNASLASIWNEYKETIAAEEGLDTGFIQKHVDKGTMVLLKNPAHGNCTPTLIGQPAGIKVNANFGTSPLVNDPANELEKLKVAVRAGAHAVMDLSIGGDLAAIRKDVLQSCTVPLGTVPIYGVAQKYIAKGEDPSNLTGDELLSEIEFQAEQGVDFMTVHCGVTRRAVELAGGDNRILGIVSRGGSLLAKWMRDNGQENPLLTSYDRLLDIALKHNVTLSLGDGLRPGAGADAGDLAQWEEVIVLGELTLRAWEKGVQVMIEGPGHVPLDLVQGIKRLCHGAPLYVLGPLTTDIAAGYDHIAGAIGGAMAGYFGADFLCYLTPAEHLTLPCENDVWQGVKASLVAAHSAEVALKRPQAVRRNDEMSRARMDLDWQAMQKLALDPEVVGERRKEFAHKDECAMCGEFCAVKLLK